ncbi:MAG: 2-oxoacid:acceptor oxidoreductase family protein, partial [Chloroflexota bacterium]
GRIANVVMLGAMSVLVPQVSKEAWLATLDERIPEKHRALNLKAFESGIGLVNHDGAPAR